MVLQGIPGVPPGNHEALTDRVRAVKASLRGLGEAAGLHDYELPRGFVLESEPWTAENGMLTSSGKLCRAALLKQYWKADTGGVTSAPLSPPPPPPPPPSFSSTTASAAPGLCGAMVSVLRETMPHLPERGSITGDQSLFDLGADSIACARFCSIVKQRFGVELSVVTLGRFADLFELQSTLFGNVLHGAACKLDFAAVVREEIALMRCRDWLLAGRSHLAATAGAAPTILLTGATGFVGAHLLDELRRSESLLALYPAPFNVVCLVRGASQVAAQHRLEHALRFYEIAVAPAGVPATFSVVLGDLELPRLGLAASDYERLQQTLISVVHCGAIVHAIHSFGRLRAANVGATRAVVRLCCEAGASLHHVSTIGIMNGSGVTDEAEVVPATGLPTASGYSQSKWVAEQVVRAAAAEGIAADIYRLGSVGPHSVTGRANPRDIVTRIIRGSVQLGAMCVDTDTTLPAVFPLISVDRCATAVVAGLCEERSAAAAAAAAAAAVAGWGTPPGHSAPRPPRVYHVVGSADKDRGVSLLQLHRAICVAIEAPPRQHSGTGRTPAVRRVDRAEYRRLLATVPSDNALFAYASVLAGVGYSNAGGGAVFADGNTRALSLRRSSPGGGDLFELLGPTPAYSEAQLGTAVRAILDLE